MASRPKKTTLNPQQRRFVDRYMICFSASRAALESGYSAKDNSRGAKLMANDLVRQEIDKRCTRITAKLTIDADDVHQGFARIATDSRPVAEGGPTVSERIAALRELGKLLGMYVDRHLHVGTTLEQLLTQVDELEKEQAQKHLNG